MEIAVYNKEGQATSRKVKVPEEVFGIEPNDHSIYLVVKQFLANNRQGTHKAKERAEISGSTKKIKRQKWTGGARAGSLKSPVFVGGGRVFGPKPRDYSFKLNKKEKQLARRSALSYKAKSNEILVLEEINYETPKTKEFRSLMKNLNLSNKKTLLVVKESNKNLYLSSRNLATAKVVTVSELSTYDVMHASNVILSESSVSEIEKLLNN